MTEEEHLVSLLRSSPLYESFSDSLVCDCISGAKSHNIAGIVPDMYHVLMRCYPSGGRFKVKSFRETFDIPTPGQRRRSSRCANNADSWSSHSIVLSTSSLSVVEIVMFLLSDIFESSKHSVFWSTKINDIKVTLFQLGSEFFAIRHFLNMSARILSLDPTYNLVCRTEPWLIIEIISIKLFSV